MDPSPQYFAPSRTSTRSSSITTMLGRDAAPSKTMTSYPAYFISLETCPPMFESP